MYNLLIVDDEPIIVDGLTVLIEKQFPELFSVLTAYRSTDALRQCEYIRPDIVLSDILMPGMSGLELQEKIRLKWPDCQFIFITGHDDSTYVRKALNNGSTSYVLKTEGDATIIAAIDKALDSIERHYHMQDILEEAERVKRASLPLLRDQLFMSVINGEVEDGSEIQDRLLDLEFPLSADNPVLPALLLFEDTSSVIKKQNQPDQRLILNAILKRLLPQVEFMSCNVSFHQTAYIFQGQGEYAPIVYATLEQAQDLFQQRARSSFTAVVGDSPVFWTSLNVVFFQLHRKASQINAWGALQLANVSEGEPKELTEKRLINMLRKALENRHKEEFIKIFDQLVLFYSQDASSEGRDMIAGMLSMAGLACEIGSDLEEVSGAFLEEDLRTVISYLNQKDGWQRGVSVLRETFQKIIKEQQRETNARALRLIRRLHDYINQNLDGDLSLTRLGQEMNYNGAYLSTLHKRETGITLTDYVIQLRVEKAKKLLSDSELRVRQIAVVCGFESPQYFNRIFRKKNGMTPVEYRSRHLSGNQKNRHESSIP